MTFRAHFLTLLLAALFMSSTADAQSSAKKVLDPGKAKKEKATAPKKQNSETLHPFYEAMNFLGGTFKDPQNPECRQGFIGWVENEEGAPELVFVDDIFRRVTLNCTRAQLQKSDLSCLARRRITYSHINDGTLYRSMLTQTNTSVEKPTFRLERFVGKERAQVCNYEKLL